MLPQENRKPKARPYSICHLTADFRLIFDFEFASKNARARYEEVELVGHHSVLSLGDLSDIVAN